MAVRRRSNIDSQIELFRRLALSLPGAVESSHMNHPDFRLNDRIFATLSGQESGCGVLKLTPEQQQEFVTDQPKAFSPVQGGWGRMGMTFVRLDEADESLIAGSLKIAYNNLLAKQSAKKSVKPAKPKRKPLQ
jgi:YjbR